MLIIGAKGFAKEVLEVVNENVMHNEILFYDDVTTDLEDKLFDKFKILRSEKEVLEYFDNKDFNFTIGIGNPFYRKKMYDKFSALGGIVKSTISKNCTLGSFGVIIGEGSNILSGSIFSNNTKLGICCIVYYNTIITHDCIIEDFVELSPGATLLGNCKIGSFTQIGSNATVLPKIKIGHNVIIGAGSIVTKDIPDNCLAVGSPAKVIKELEPLRL